MEVHICTQRRSHTVDKDQPNCWEVYLGGECIKVVDLRLFETLSAQARSLTHSLSHILLPSTSLPLLFSSPAFRGLLAYNRFLPLGIVPVPSILPGPGFPPRFPNFLVPAGGTAGSAQGTYLGYFSGNQSNILLAGISSVGCSCCVANSRPHFLIDLLDHGQRRRLPVGLGPQYLRFHLQWLPTGQGNHFSGMDGCESNRYVCEGQRACG